MPEIPYSWLEGQLDCYTIADLQALSNADLNALAAELRGWVLRIEEYQIGEPVIESGVLRDYVAADGRTMSAVADWSPCLDRNQSGKLLRHAEKQDIQFIVHFLNKMGASIHWREGDYGFWNYVSGNDARAETIAFCAAMLAMEGRLANE
jgi:hypothetical protein